MEYSDNNFDFNVINGGWTGNFKDGVVSHKYGKVDKLCKILSSDQSKLRGSDYNTIIQLWENEGGAIKRIPCT